MPEPRFDHLRHLTGEFGIWEHARFSEPRVEHGYCTDDNARALIVVCRQTDPGPELVDLGRKYLRFLEDAAMPDRGLHNRRDADGTWADDIGSDDSQGRAIWALGTAAAIAPDPTMRDTAAGLLAGLLDFSSPSPRSNALAILGATAYPGAEAATAAVARWCEVVAPDRSTGWPWPEPRLAYDNARIPESLIAAGGILDDRLTIDRGLELLHWLVNVETRERHFSFTPVGGWGPGETRPGFDQQPLEAAATADACARAYEVTGDRHWADLTVRAALWFTGENDTGVAVYDPDTGGGFDGLQRDGVNRNQGAESTIAALTTLQQAGRMLREDGS